MVDEKVSDTGIERDRLLQEGETAGCGLRNWPIITPTWAPELWDAAGAVRLGPLFGNAGKSVFIICLFCKPYIAPKTKGFIVRLSSSVGNLPYIFG